MHEDVNLKIIFFLILHFKESELQGFVGSGKKNIILIFRAIIGYIKLNSYNYKTIEINLLKTIK